jgi:hypothetical protein
MMSGALVMLEPVTTLEISTANVMASLLSEDLSRQDAAYGWLCGCMQRAARRKLTADELSDLTVSFIEGLLADELRASLVALYNVGGLISMMRRYLGEEHAERDVEARWWRALRRKIRRVLSRHPRFGEAANGLWELHGAAAPCERLSPLPASLVSRSERRLPPIASNETLELYLVEVFSYLACQGRRRVTVAQLTQLCWEMLTPRPEFLESMGVAEVAADLSAELKLEIEQLAATTLERLDSAEAQVTLARAAGTSQRAYAAERGVKVHTVEARWSAILGAAEAAGIAPGQWGSVPAARQYYGELIMAGLERLSAEET